MREKTIITNNEKVIELRDIEMQIFIDAKNCLELQM